MYDNEYISNLTFKRKLLLTVLGVIFFATSLFIIFSSISFNFNETGWLALSNIESKNIFGIYGSYTSGFLIKEFGILTPFCLALIFLMYSFVFSTKQSKLWFKSILTLVLIFLLGLLSQPFHMFLSLYFIEESKILTYKGFSYRAFEFILGYLNTALNLSSNQIFIILNLCITIFVILNFVYVASTKFKELFFLNNIFKPFYLPIIWIIQLINSLLIKKVYFETESDFYADSEKRGFIQNMNELLNIIRRKKKTIQPKEKINVKNLNCKKKIKKPLKKINKQKDLPLVLKGFILPSIDLPINQKIENLMPDKDVLNANAKLLEGVLKDYSIDGLIETVQQGPVVTRYDLKPAPGLEVKELYLYQMI